MWFVYYELVSFIICYGLNKIIDIVMINKIRRELNLTKKQVYLKLSPVEIKNIIVYLIPILNIITISIYLLRYNKFYENLKLSLETAIKKEKERRIRKQMVGW